MRQYDAVCDGDHKFTLFSPNGQNKNNEEQGNRIKLWPRQGFHEGNLVKSLHGIDVS